MILHLNTIYKMRFSRKHSAGVCSGIALASTSREAPTWEKRWLMFMNSLTELLWQHTKQDCSQRDLHHCQRHLRFLPGWGRALWVEFQRMGSHQLRWPPLGKWRKHLLCYVSPFLIEVLLIQAHSLLHCCLTWEEAATQQSCYTTTSIWI